MADDPREDDELAAELERLAAQKLPVEMVDPETGEVRLEGFMTREHLARAMIERDEPIG